MSVHNRRQTRIYISNHCIQLLSLHIGIHHVQSGWHIFEAALLVDGQMGEFEKVYELNKAIHLPVCLNDIEITEEEWEETMNRIPDMSDVAHYPYRVTRDMLVKAMNELDMRNKK